MRIVSLVPSITELLYYLKLEEQVVGITKFCVHPTHSFRTKTRVGGTKNISIPTIKNLAPTLVIASKEENIKEQVDSLKTFCRVHITDVKDYNGALKMITTIGTLTDTRKLAENIVEKIEKKFSALQNINTAKAAYIIWKKPWMVAGGDTFIHSMMEKAGFENVFGDQLRYPQVDIYSIATLNPEYILLSTEPYPFKNKDVQALQKEFPQIKVLLIDGEMFSWYGCRMLYAPRYFSNIRK